MKAFAALLNQFISIILILTLAVPAAERHVGYTVKYSGGSLPTVKSGQDLNMFLYPDAIHLRSVESSRGIIRLNSKDWESKKAAQKPDVATIPTASITEISYGQEVRRRIGEAVAAAVFSLGIGVLVALSKSKKHYIGIVWDDAGKKGGVVVQADKNEYRGLIAALEGLTAKKAVDTDAGMK